MAMNPSISAFLRLLQQAPPRQVISLLALMGLSAATDGVGMVMLVPMLDLIAGGSMAGTAGRVTEVLRAAGMPQSTGALLAFFVALVALRALIMWRRGKVSSALQFTVVDGLRLRSFAALLAVEWRWLVASRRSDHATLLLDEVNRVGMGLNVGIQLLVSMVAIAVHLAVALVLSPAMTGLVMVSGAVVFWLLAGQQKQALALGHRQARASRALHGNVQESLAGIRLSKVLGSAGRHLDQFRATMADLRHHQLDFIARTGLNSAIFQCGGALLLAIYLYVGLTVWRVPVAQLLTLVLIFSRLVPMFMAAQGQLYQWTHAMPALQDVEALLAQCEAHAEPLMRDDDQRQWDVRDAIVLDQVCMTYGDRDRPALDHVSVRFPARKTTAIMGASGSGKSTLADIVMSLLEADAGRLLVDGAVISGDQRASWRRSVAYVPQDTFLFHDTIRNNLMWGNPAASEADLRAALERAAAGFVFALPKSLETMVGDGGVRLSGGERQRLALARALLRKPSLMILDEATSALDLENETRIREAIETLHGDLTMIIIGHRLPTLEHADQVVVLDAGRVVAQGSWADVAGAQR